MANKKLRHCTLTFLLIGLLLCIAIYIRGILGTGVISTRQLIAMELCGRSSGGAFWGILCSTTTTLTRLVFHLIDELFGNS